MAISSSRAKTLDRLQLLNVNYSILRCWGDNELAPGDSGDTSFNESRWNLWNLRSGTMRRYWLVRRSPAQPPFVLMKADTGFSHFFAHLGAVSPGWLLFQWEKLKIGTLAFCPRPLWTAHHLTGCLLLPDSFPRQLGDRKNPVSPYGCIPPRTQSSPHFLHVCPYNDRIWQKSRSPEVQSALLMT